MSDIQVSIRSLVPLAISDHMARKTSYQYGVVVGKLVSAAHVLAFDTFDLKVENDQVDLEYLQKRLQLLQAVSPQLSLIGLYTCIEYGHIESSLAKQISQDGRFPTPLISLVPQSNGDFKCYSLATNQDIAYELTPGETEQIAVSSTLKHPNYSQQQQDLILDNETNFAASLHQMSVVLGAVLSSESLSAEAERSLVHLAHTVYNYQGREPEEDYSLITSHLSILSSQVGAIFAANEQIARRISGTSKGRMAFPNLKRFTSDSFMDI